MTKLSKTEKGLVGVGCSLMALVYLAVYLGMIALIVFVIVSVLQWMGVI